MPQILLTNDDGVQARGLLALRRALVAVGEVTVFAPDHNWSAAGHTKTMHKPLRVRRTALADGSPALTTTGAPSDCVGLALLGMTPQRPHLVVSGINEGSNVGHDITYSGTVAAAMEAVVTGVPAIAASWETVPMRRAIEMASEAWGTLADEDGDEVLAFAARFVADLAALVLGHGLPEHTLLNVNFPAVRPPEMRGVAVTRLGRRVYRDVLVERQDPRGKPYYWIGGSPPSGIVEQGTDIGALAQGYVSVTPLNMDMTDRQLLPVLERWEMRLPAVP
ncbi:MAG: 5'/3'-nucleotidase SurE [Chloroflexi bacterium]|nr:5'/3'-nucleotidase SurE [Chloroflexota bacterium]